MKFTNYLVKDEVGRRYRVTLSEGGTPLYVGRKCLAGGREAVLSPWGRKGKILVAKVRAGDCERIKSLKERAADRVS